MWTAVSSIALCALPPPLRVLGVQIAPGANIQQRATQLIRENPGHELYVMPELSSHGYDDTVLSQLDSYAEKADGSIFQHFSNCARDVNAYICYGYLRRTECGGCTICQAVVDPSGELVLSYDKMHLCDMGACSEVGYGVQPGSTPGVFEINGVKVGVTICYDIRFPELYRKLAWDADCDLILHPSAFIRDATFPCYHQFVTTRAVENGVYLLSVNYAGEDFGDSIAVPPWVGPVPGLIDEGDDQGGAYGHDEGVLSTRSLGIEEGVLPLLVQPGHCEAVRKAYPYRRNIHESLRPQG